MPVFRIHLAGPSGPHTVDRNATTPREAREAVQKEARLAGDPVRVVKVKLVRSVASVASVGRTVPGSQKGNHND